MTRKKKPVQKIDFAGACELPLAELDKIMKRQSPVDPEELLGYEYLGYNVHMPASFLKMFGKFKKTFYRDNQGVIRGWNYKCRSNLFEEAWEEVSGPDDRRSDGFFTRAQKQIVHWFSGLRGDARAHGFFRVYPAKEDPTWNHYPAALLVNYGSSGNPPGDFTALLRDYVVAINPGESDLLLGKGYTQLGLTSVPAGGYFILSRGEPLREILTPGGGDDNG